MKKVRAYESIPISVDGIPQIEGYTLTDWKNLLAKGIERCVRDGRNLSDWHAYDYYKSWVPVEGQPDHTVDPSLIEFTTYKHGGTVNLQAVYFFEIEV